MRTSHLNRGRERARTVFFEEIGYVLFCWSENEIQKEMGAPLLVSAYPCTTSSIEKIDTVTLTFDCLRSYQGLSEQYNTTPAWERTEEKYGHVLRRLA